jgi:hypothetical protein
MRLFWQAQLNLVLASPVSSGLRRRATFFDDFIDVDR